MLSPATRASARIVIVPALALVLASLLNADGLHKTAYTQADGVRRDLALEVTSRLVEVSRFLRLSVPRDELQAVVGREEADEIDVEVHLAVPPPAAGRAAHDRVPVDPGTEDERAPTPAAAAPSARPRFDVARPLRVWVAGDSLAQIPGEALQRATGPGSAVEVLRVESRLSTGLARPDLFNWYSRFMDVIRQLEPDVAVLSFGADDAHDYMAGVPSGREIGPLGSPTWNAEYRRRVDGVTRELNAAGIATVWLGLPIPDGPGFARSFPVVNKILLAVANAHRGTSAYVDTWHLLDSAAGKYTPYLRVGGKLRLVRAADGVHYTEVAGGLVAEAVMRELRRLYELEEP